MAHPYTSLGGCYDDFVVLSVVAELVKLGIVVGTFNFRYVLCGKMNAIDVAPLLFAINYPIYFTFIVNARMWN